MSDVPQFSTLLQNQLAICRLDVNDLAKLLDIRNVKKVMGWIDGTSVPPSSRIIEIALLLDADPIDVATSYFTTRVQMDRRR